MINKNSSLCNRAISFESLFTYIGVRSLLAKAKFSKRSGADVFTLLSVLVTSIFKGIQICIDSLRLLKVGHYLLVEILCTDFCLILSMTGNL